MQLCVGKWGDLTLSAAINDGPKANLFVKDKAMATEFLVDTGSGLCVFPRTCIKGQAEKSTYEMYASNRTMISTYDVWKFADVAKPQLVDQKNRRLLNTTISLSATERIATREADSARTIVGDSAYHRAYRIRRAKDTSALLKAFWTSTLHMVPKKDSG